MEGNGAGSLEGKVQSLSLQILRGKQDQSISDKGPKRAHNGSPRKKSKEVVVCHVKKENDI